MFSRNETPTGDEAEETITRPPGSSEMGPMELAVPIRNGDAPEGMYTRAPERALSSDHPYISIDALPWKFAESCTYSSFGSLARTPDTSSTIDTAPVCGEGFPKVRTSLAARFKRLYSSSRS